MSRTRPPASGPAHIDCFICCDSADAVAHYPCGHAVCLRCATKLLFLYAKPHCPLCKSAGGKPVFMAAATHIAEGASGTRALQLRAALEDAAAFYATPKEQQRTAALRAPSCRLCTARPADTAALAAHYKRAHSKLLCTVCAEHNHLLPDEYATYDFGDLERHRNGTLGEPGFSGHPRCTHCARLFFDADALKRHCHEAHQLCTVCEVAGRRLRFYADYPALERHYRARHHCCTNALCVRNHCYVYGNKSELWAHCVEQHGMAIQLADLPEPHGTDQPVCALGDEHEPAGGGLFQHTASIVSPLVNAPYFPSFSTATGACVPQCMDRAIASQERQAAGTRLRQIQLVTKVFRDEIAAGITQYIDGGKNLEMLVKEIEDAVGNKVCLRLLETVGFLQRQREVDKFVVGYRKNVMFPLFTKSAAKAPVAPVRVTPVRPGFRILDLSGAKPVVKGASDEAAARSVHRPGQNGPYGNNARK